MTKTIRTTAAMLLLAALALFAPAAQADPNKAIVVLASAAQGGSGSSTVLGGGADISACVGRTAMVYVPVTAGSGTVSTFRVRLQVSPDGVTWGDVFCIGTVSAGGTATANTNNIMNEAVVTATGTAAAQCYIPLGNARASWVVNGTTPNETFSVIVACAQ